MIAIENLGKFLGNPCRFDCNCIVMDYSGRHDTHYIRWIIIINNNCAIRILIPFFDLYNCISTYLCPIVQTKAQLGGYVKAVFREVLFIKFYILTIGPDDLFKKWFSIDKATYFQIRPIVQHYLATKVTRTERDGSSQKE